jgi:hypothetical protein
MKAYMDAFDLEDSMVHIEYGAKVWSKDPGIMVLTKEDFITFLNHDENVKDFLQGSGHRSSASEDEAQRSLFQTES